jgi:Ni/Fe-hydrogenase 1 B-type cytochrome subunit
MSQAQSADESTRLAGEIAGVSAVPEEPKVTLYVWDLPVRVTHWVNVASILMLSVTGYYIANPFIQTQGIATDQFLMGTVRFVHYTTAFIFTVSVVFRVYWAFASRARYARWDQFLPLRGRRRRALLRMVGYYTFLRKQPPPEIGHNSLAGVTYMGLYGLFALQILTGFALYSIPFHGGAWPTLFGWIITIFGAQPVRLVHTLIMFLIIAFTIHHVYSAILIDIEERSGLVSSIITGRKSLTRQHITDALEEDHNGGLQHRGRRGAQRRGGD